MSSERRIQSSRANGARSHGPVTPAGRLKSAYNNLRHGILAETVVLEDENSETFNEILAALTREFDPQTEAQLGLVETMASARWRLMRIWSIERQTLKSEIGKHDPGKHDPAARAALAFHDLANNSRTLDVINRYESRYDRQYSRSLNLLLKLARFPITHSLKFAKPNLSPTNGHPKRPPSRPGPPGRRKRRMRRSPSPPGTRPQPRQPAPPDHQLTPPDPRPPATKRQSPAVSPPHPNPLTPNPPLPRKPRPSATIPSPAVRPAPPIPLTPRPKPSHTISKKFAATY